MTWFYVQSTGELHEPSGKTLAKGYSGNTAGLNNPSAQARIGVGPIPVGEYTVGPPHVPVDHLGPVALPLWPAPANNMHGRSGFFMHGDNAAMNHTASHGCIIMPPIVRRAVNASADKRLHVVAIPADLSPH